MIPALFSEIKSHTADGIAAQIRHSVDIGLLSPGEMLPAIRSLAEHLGVNRNTVASAYKKLQTSGVIEASGRAGSRVTLLADEELSDFDSAPVSSHVVDMASGNPDPELLPKISARLLNANRPVKLYGPDMEYQPLLGWASSHFSADGVCGENCCITSGIMDAVEKILLTHAKPGDRIAVESPCFVGILNVLRQLGLTPVGVPMDTHGLLPERLHEVLESGVHALICTPRAQNPTGVSISDGRQQELRALLGVYPELLVIEDDHFAFLADEPMRSVIPESSKYWAVARSFSKHFGPDLRVGMMVSDAITYQRVRRRQATGARWVSHILQEIAHSLATDPTTSKQVAAAAAHYRERRSLLVSELDRLSISVAGELGLNVWVPLRSDKGIAATLAASGWFVRDSAAFRVSQPVPGIRVSTATITRKDARAFAETLSSILQRGTGSFV